MLRHLALFIFLYSFLWGENSIEYDYELDSYYSNISIFIDLDKDNEIQNYLKKSEFQIYKDLLTNSLHPNIFLMEAALYPIPLAGVYIKEKKTNLYQDLNYNKDSNYLRVLTAGFEEPFALSFFIGRMVVFKKKSLHRVGKNRAYMGTLFSIGSYTIKDNILHKNKWLNIEYKLKGTRDKEESDLDWSFRIGYKMNENHNFVDTLYIGARRSNVDFKATNYSLVKNSAFKTLVEVSAKDFSFTSAELTIEKKFPLNFLKKIVFGIVAGYIYTSPQKYSGHLRDEGVEKHQIIFRPNLTF